MPVDAAELLGASLMPAAIQRSTICPSCQRLTLAAWSADLDHRLDRVRRPEGSSERRWYAQPPDREGLGQAFAQAGGGPGIGAAQLARERFQVGLGDQGVELMVGAAHPLGHGRGERVGQPVGDVAELVELAAAGGGRTPPAVPLVAREARWRFRQCYRLPYCYG